ncbi:hypothetical protein IEO21_09445 [Rhodonia placenta]|uniref:Pheromone receptor n=1 Tax=Rhodonia placenta TaxID=104341 RepID=A0A8H7NUB4_9APHY|nr:hypothetical protein IEO21_09445 [Postia placenta]
MGIELPIVSILCAVLLLCLIPAYLIAGNVAATSLVGWLLLCNLIQAIDSAVWENNTSIRTPAWCDIATKLLLGARIALPAACLGISRHLRRRTSTFDFGSRRSIPWADYALCFVLPIMYMILQLWLHGICVFIPSCFDPGLATSILALDCRTRRLIHRTVSSHAFFPKSNNFAFFRVMISSLLIASLTLASGVVTVYVGVESPPGLQPWRSWTSVHDHISEIQILTSSTPMQFISIEMAWWVIPASSFVLFASVVAGMLAGTRDQVLDDYRTFLWRLQLLCGNRDAPRRPSESFIDLHGDSRSRLSDTVSPTRTPSAKSAWKSPSLSSLKSAPLSITIPNTMPLSPPPSTEFENTDATFAQSTMSYLDSPAGKSAVSLVLPPPAFKRPSRPAPPLDLGPQRAPEEDAHYNRPNSPPPRPSSILSEPWPRPPSAIPISPVVPVTIHPPSPRPGHAPSRPPSRASFSTSLASSTVTMSAYASDVERALRDSPTLPQFAPFADAGMPTGELHARGLSLAVPKRTRNMRSKDVMVTRNLSLSLRTRERAREEEGTGPGIYMTVVKQTV